MELAPDEERVLDRVEELDVGHAELLEDRDFIRSDIDD
jgi:hypothetical protein